MNNQVLSSEDSRLDEWGDYIQRKEDVIRIKDDGVLEAIQNNNPAITAVSVHVDEEDDDDISDWGAVGRHLGNTTHVKHLYLEFFEIMNSLDLSSFCDGLAVNTSVESLQMQLCFTYNDDDDYNARLDSFPDDLFRKLLPFFKNNNNLIAVDVWVNHGFPTESVNDVVSASSSLKSIKIEGYDHCLENLVMIISKKGEVRHITINSGFLSESASLQIEKFLSHDQCQLKSLKLCASVYNLYIDNIISGIFNNKSLEYLQLPRDDYTISFLESLRHTKLSSIKKLRLSSVEIPPITALCHQMPNIKTLNLGSYRLNNSLWGTSPGDMIPISTPSLQVLRIKGITPPDVLLGELSLCLSNKYSLQSLTLHDRCHDIPSETWINMFNSIPTPQLKSIYINGIITCDSVMASFCNWVSSIQRLRIMDVSNCSDLSSNGIQSLATALESLTNMEEVYFVSIQRGDVPNMNVLLHALMTRPTLKKISVPIGSINQLQTIANALQSPACSLTKLIILHNTGRGMTRPRLVETEREQLSQIMIDALHRNNTLKSLVFDTRAQERLFVGQSLRDLLCNKSSIDATYFSNHSLHSLRTSVNVIRGSVNALPFEIYSMLHSNKVPDKYAVAREKILQHHKLEDVNFAPSSLPVAMSWIGKSNSNLGLSQQYRLIRSAPHLIQNDYKKRKRQKFD
eukprot:scaffold38911_cov36-Cyclotella_meneghiniana.AAC.1